LQRLNSHGIYTIARIICFKDSGIGLLRPEYAFRTTEGTIYRENGRTDGHIWLNPYNRDVWAYLTEIMVETAKLGFDEIQLEFVHFPTDSEIRRVEFTEEMTGGLSKTEILNEFARYVMDKLAPYGVTVSANIFATVIRSDHDANLIGQDYEALAFIYDVLCPIVYPSSFAEGTLGVHDVDTKPYEIINEIMRISTRKMNGLKGRGEEPAKIRPWIWDAEASWLRFENRAYMKYTGRDVQEQIKALSDNGVYEWLLWCPLNNYDGYRELTGIEW
jgi:hypothetical protein